MVIYMDESGDLGSIRGSKFFVIAALVTRNRRELEHCVKRVRQRKMGKKTPFELKAFDATDRVRCALLNCTAKQDIGIYAVIADKLLIAEELGRGANDLYNRMTCSVIGHCLRDAPIKRLVIDKRGDQIVRRNFDEYIRKTHGDIEIEHLDSRNDKVIQTVDFVAWSIRRKYAGSDKRFYDLIAGKIRCEKLWSGH